MVAVLVKEGTMRRLFAVVALALVALAGCGKDDAKTTGTVQGDSVATMPESSGIDFTTSPDTTMEVR